MNSLPPFAANTNESDHPALESIAAYLDGRLPEAERSALTAHLDSCAACYEIYTESMRFQKEESAEAQKSVLPFERRKTAWIPVRIVRTFALPLAALLLVGVGVAVWHQLHLPLEPIEVEKVTASLKAPDNVMTEKLAPFDTNRGLPEEPRINYPVLAFQSGATLVDLRVAMESNDPDKISLVAQNLNALYNNGVIVPDEQEKERVAVAVGHFLDGAPSPSLHETRLNALFSLAAILRSQNADSHLSPHFDLGTWTEAGRLAAYGRRMGFFADSANRRSLGWFRRNPPIPEVKSALVDIENSWPERSSVPANLGSKFDEVIKPYDVSPTEE